jgi:spore coat protein U-like protein
MNYHHDMKVLQSPWKYFGGASLVFVTLPSAAQAVFTATSVMPVRMEIVASCLVSVDDLDFGSYASNSTTPVLAQTNIQLNCGPGSTAEIALDAGTSPGGNTSRRKLLHNSRNDRLDYGLYQDAGRTQHWGDKSGNDTVELMTTGSPQTIPIYGEIPARQRPRDGTYSDVITLSVYY